MMIIITTIITIIINYDNFETKFQNGMILIFLYRNYTGFFNRIKLDRTDLCKEINPNYRND